MPCNSFGGGNEPIIERIVYRDNPTHREENKGLKIEIVSLKESRKSLEAGLCAIISELEKRGIANEIISDANKNGMINLSDFWAHHSQEDETRLAVKLHEFSEHEQEVLKRLLNKKGVNK